MLASIPVAASRRRKTDAATMAKGWQWVKMASETRGNGEWRNVLEYSEIRNISHQALVKQRLGNNCAA